MNPLRICLAASEVAPFAKTGGLADVVAGLGRELARRGHDVRIVMPLYRRVREQGHVSDQPPLLRDVHVNLGGASRAFDVLRGSLPGAPADRAEVWFVDCPPFFARDELYSSAHPDEHLRFALLSRAVLETCQRTRWIPHVMHCNDWHTALVPVYKTTTYHWDSALWSVRTLMSIHNIGFQGEFDAGVVGSLDLGRVVAELHQEDLRIGRFNMLKNALLRADWIGTVSDTYAHEIRTPEGGQGLEAVLGARADRLSGIVNGVDYGDWNPAVDPCLPARYDADDLDGKLTCKRALLERMDLPVDDGALVLGMVTRLTAQKGLDLLPEVLPAFLRQYPRTRLCVLGSGEERYERFFQRLRDDLPHQIGIYRGYHEELAHQVEAGADAFLMPSLFEPCGLNQMYSLKYGTVPVVRATGGLADTVEAWDPVRETGNGFVFREFRSEALLETLHHMMGAWGHPPAWRTLMRNGMAADFSWQRQADHYENLYRHIVDS